MLMFAQDKLIEAGAIARPGQLLVPNHLAGVGHKRLIINTSIYLLHLF